RVVHLKQLRFSVVHVHSAGKTWVEASHRTHNVDAFEAARAVLLEDGGILDRILIGARCSVNIPRIRVPRSWRVRMVIGNLAVANYDVMRQHPAYSLMEPAANRLFGNGEVRPCLGSAGEKLSKSSLEEVVRDGASIGLKVGARAVTFDCI